MSFDASFAPFAPQSVSTVDQMFGEPSKILSPHGDKGKWAVAWERIDYRGDIDEYRAKYGKVEGEAKFFRDKSPQSIARAQENLLMLGGASLMLEALIGNSFTAFNGTNSYIGVGDSSNGEICNQTDLQASTNKARQQVDSGYPTHSVSVDGKAISNTTGSGVSPITVTTSTSHGFANNSFVLVQSVIGNSNANGLWKITNVTSTTFDLVGSTGNGTFISAVKAYAAQCNTAIYQATFGELQANFAWNEVALFNASTSGLMLNRKVASLGTKSNGSSSALRLAVGIQ